MSRVITVAFYVALFGVTILFAKGVASVKDMERCLQQTGNASGECIGTR